LTPSWWLGRTIHRHLEEGKAAEWKAEMKGGTSEIVGK